MKHYCENLLYFAGFGSCCCFMHNTLTSSPHALGLLPLTSTPTLTQKARALVPVSMYRTNEEDEIEDMGRYGMSSYPLQPLQRGESQNSTGSVINDLDGDDSDHAMQTDAYGTEIYGNELGQGVPGQLGAGPQRSPVDSPRSNEGNPDHETH